MAALATPVIIAGVIFLTALVATAGCVHLVREGTRVLTTRFGAAGRLLQPGPHWRVPGVHEWTVVRIGLQQRAFSVAGATGDHQRVTLAGTVRFRVSLPEEFVRAQAFFTTCLDDACRSAVTDVLTGFDLDQLLGKRTQLPQELRFAIEERVAFAGVTIEDVFVTELIPSAAVQRMLAEQALSGHRREMQRERLAAAGEARAAHSEARAHEIQTLADLVDGTLCDRTLDLLRAEEQRDLLRSAPRI